MSVHVKLFAGLRERAGWSEREVDRVDRVGGEQQADLEGLVAIQAEAEATYRSKIKELEASLQETQGKITEMQAKKEKGQRMSPPYPLCDMSN